jgi:hypothetical protein
MSNPTEQWDGRNDNPKAADFLIAEYQGLVESFWKTEELGDKRVEFFIAIVTALLGAMVLLERVAGLEMLGALLALLALGAVVAKRILRRNLKSHEYLRAMGRIRRYFDEQSSNALWKYMYQPPCDSRPTRLDRFNEMKNKHRIFWVLHWGTGGLLETVCLVNSLLGAGLLGLTTRYALKTCVPELSSGWLNGSAILTAIPVALVTWIAQRLFAWKEYRDEEAAIVNSHMKDEEEKPRVRFPCSARD